MLSLFFEEKKKKKVIQFPTFFFFHRGKKLASPNRTQNQWKARPNPDYRLQNISLHQTEDINLTWKGTEPKNNNLTLNRQCHKTIISIFIVRTYNKVLTHETKLITINFMQNLSILNICTCIFQLQNTFSIYAISVIVFHKTHSLIYNWLLLNT